MATIVIPERLNGKYDGVTPPALLAPGSLSGGKNMRKGSQGGGWKPRKGCALHDTSALGGGEAVKSLHYYKNPFSADEHFIAQCNSKLYRESAQGKLPPEVDTSYGTDVGVTVGTTPGFSAHVGEYFFYADGSGRPIAYGGDSPRGKGCFVYDASEVKFGDYSRKVADGRADTQAIVVGAATDYFIVLTEERCEGLTFDLGTNVNSNAVTAVVHAYRSGTWTAVGNLVDGTDSPAGTTLAIDGSLAWDRSTSDTLYSYQGIQGYAYKVGWSGALSGNVDVVSVECTQDACLMTNKWNGEMNWVTGCRFFDVSVGAGEMQESLGKVTNESTSMYIDISAAQIGDFLYLKTPEPATIFGLAIVTGYSNTNNAQIDRIEYWSGSGWTALTTNLADATLDTDADSSFSQTGTFAFDGNAASPERMLMDGDPIPGYWYRLSWDAALSADVRIYAILYGSHPDVLPTYDGCVEFKGRLFVWGDPEFPNRLRYSAKDAPFCFSGMDSGYTDPFGAKDVILCAVKFYNELIVFKEHSVWLLEGEGPATFGTLKITDKVGLGSPKSAQVAEVGFPALHRDEPMTIAIWQDVDGVYTFDGRKTKKESPTVDHYFNPESSDCIAAASIRSLQSFVDPNNDEYHLLLPAVELVFNYVTAEWYPPWEREIVLATGVDFRANDNRHYTYGASAAGWIMRLETDTTDKPVGTELMASQADRDFSSVSGWTNSNLASYDETDDLTITADAIGQYCTLSPVRCATVEGKYCTIEFDVANLVGNWKFESRYGVYSILDEVTEGANTHYFTAEADNYGIKIVATAANSSADFDNFTVKEYETAINHSVKSRAIGYEKGERLVRFSLRRLWAELKARAYGTTNYTVTTKTHKDLATDGTAQVTPQAMSQVNTGYNITVPKIDCNPTLEECRCFQVEFSLDKIDREMEIYGFSYEISGKGLSEQ